jgi:hypothetical protein
MADNIDVFIANALDKAKEIEQKSSGMLKSKASLIVDKSSIIKELNQKYRKLIDIILKRFKESLDNRSELANKLSNMILLNTELENQLIQFSSKDKLLQSKSIPNQVMIKLSRENIDKYTAKMKGADDIAHQMSRSASNLDCSTRDISFIKADQNAISHHSHDILKDEQATSCAREDILNESIHNIQLDNAISIEILKSEKAISLNLDENCQVNATSKLKVLSMQNESKKKCSSSNDAYREFFMLTFLSIKLNTLNLIPFQFVNL